MSWIKLDKDMVDDPRLLEIAVRFAAAAELDLPRRDAVTLFGNALRGALVTLWCYADTHIRDDDTLELSALAIDSMVGIDGFCAALPDEWLVELDDGRVLLPGYCVKNGLISKKPRREAAAARQRRFKQRQREAGNGVTDALPPAVDQDLDLDRKKKEDPPLASASGPPATTTEAEAATPPAGRRTATRIPEDFELTPERRAIAETEQLDPERTFAKFVDYWRSASGARARKHDWEATWRNWCRSEADRNRSAPRPRATDGGKLSAVDRVRLATGGRRF